MSVRIRLNANDGKTRYLVDAHPMRGVEWTEDANQAATFTERKAVAAAKMAIKLDRFSDAPGGKIEYEPVE